MYIKKIVAATALIGLVIAGIFAYVVYGKFFSPNTAFNNDEAHVYIPSDANYTDVRAELEPLLKNPVSFDEVAERKGYTNAIKAGHFIIKKGSNNNEIVNSIRSGNIPVKISFNNQERLENLAGRIAVQIEADSLELLKAFKDENFLKEHGLNQQNALTMYLPNTYEFYWNTNAEEFRDRMLQEYQRFWTPERTAKAEAQGLNPQEVYTLASIVQKETAKADERPRVAGVYLNRLQNGWKLDADPTVIYAVKNSQNDFDQVIKRVLYRDLETDSPYNTYKYGGLPPGPIFMPDLSAINAVLNPEKHEYYFFVADVSNPGYHLFAKTVAQHNANRRQYIDWINAQGINR
ncbi:MULTISPECIES: endolytic transglycosylase MltG [unclassified Leeuwenhoekiella]|uniref:endolytic transglycosylase MltG n=1 Tax=unclassified Leeuwenhoekiella TaxID=2615029 RepID=UPI000C6B6FD8|nr:MULTISPECIES: endolytic transglycosylase MltG [unclassified Leeuwenhoekiella]MAW94636.1 aminodeoxychorismate lyase [Leeuwenhoekiella sp.]MBA82059.1 aminodeoxychorismate lyase [Leeuwenhoekiella sp.]|tara:strand:+ start:41917 stop:42960 length:1044 start_codon:yes stop_codon:yes gene_type:complete